MKVDTNADISESKDWSKGLSRTADTYSFANPIRVAEIKKQNKTKQTTFELSKGRLQRTIEEFISIR